ncbi:MAG: 5'-3' exonuclease H3TH domain-containing protein [Lentisphaeria bacterium]
MSFHYKSNQILLVDAYGYIYRSFYGIRNLTNPRGEDVNALYGMARLFMSLELSMKSDFGAIVYDLGKCSRRCELLPAYKAQRPPMPDALRSQLPIIREWASAFGWGLVEKRGLEADDLLAAIAEERDKDQEVGIFSFDKDILQLVNEKVKVLTLGPKNALKVTDTDEVVKKFGVSPAQVIDYLALVGDSADNINGVRGVGPKTAALLLNQYGTIDGIIEHVDEIKKTKLHDTLIESKDLMRRNYSLVRLDQELPDEWAGLETIRRKEPDWDRIEKLAMDQNFKSFLITIQKQKKQSAQLDLF